MNITYIKIFTDALETWAMLTDEECGRLVRAMLVYQHTGQPPALEGNERFLFPTCKAQLDRDNTAYRTTCASRSDAGKKGASNRWQSHSNDSKDSKCHICHDENSKHGKEKEKDKDKEKEKDKDKEKDDTYCAEPEKSGSTPTISLPLNDGNFYPISLEQCQEWAGLYPAVDVIQQLRNMLGWLNANPTKRKTRRGINKFVNGWLAREQDRGAKPGSQARADSGFKTSNPFLEMLREEGAELE